MTILFNEDWGRYPTARPDETTKNTSFIRHCALLKSMGVKNHLFPLALVNQSLKGVDPHDPTLDLHTQSAILVEMKLNFWYAVREVYRAPARSGADSSYVRANRGNLALWWSFLGGLTPILIQIRQTGKSFSSDILAHWLMNTRRKNTDINLLTKDDVLRGRNIERIKEIDSELPSYVSRQTPSDARNNQEFTVRALGNTYRGHLPSMSPKRANALGRGVSSDTCFNDETPFQPNSDISVPAALAAGTADRDLAASVGDPHGTVFTTTAGRRDEREGAFMYKMLQDAAVWNEQYMDVKDKVELRKVIKTSGRSGDITVACVFSHRQLGYTDSWLRDAIRAAMVSGPAMEADFFNIWGNGTASSPISPKIMKEIKASARDPDYMDIHDEGYVIRWYIPEHHIDNRMSKPTIMSLDTSDAVGVDDIAMNIRDVETGEIIAAGVYNMTNLTVFSAWLLKLIMKYERMMTIIERRSSGVGILDFLLLMLNKNNINPFRRLYNTIVNNGDENPVAWREVQQQSDHPHNNLYVKYKKAFGFPTSGSGQYSRSSLYGRTLTESLTQTGHLTYDNTLTEQLAGLVVKNGRVDHGTGGHDDMVIAFLLSYWAMSVGGNLDFYGIDPLKALSAVPKAKSDNEVIKTATERYLDKTQLIAKEQLDTLTTLYKEEKDVYMRNNLERLIRVAHAKIRHDGAHTVNIDQMLASMRTDQATKTSSVMDQAEQRHKMAYH